MLTVSALICAIMALTIADEAKLKNDQTEAKLENDQTANTELDKRSAYCHRGWTGYHGRCFRYISTPMRWAQAEKYCHLLGGNLASIHSYWEYRAIQGVTWRGAYAYRDSWIGGSDAHEEGVWLWSDGTAFNYRNWCPGEPNNHGGRQNCLQMNFGAHKCWDDAQCYYRRPFVCARKAW